jgi:hypothetical protein
MELVTNEEAVLCHYKDSKLVAITHHNGRTEMFKVEEMSRGDFKEFFETNQITTQTKNV